MLGVGVLLHGLAPRFATAVAYGLVAWSFLVEIVGAALGASRVDKTMGSLRATPCLPRRGPQLPGVFPGGWEGLHVFDISNLADPDLVASVETECGSHTATAVPDPANNRLLVYNTPSSGACPGLGIVQIPVDHPENASRLRFEPGGRACHDTG